MPCRSGNSVGLSRRAANEPNTPDPGEDEDGRGEAGDRLGRRLDPGQVPDEGGRHQHHEDERQGGDALVVGLDHQRQDGHQPEQGGRVVLGRAEGGVTLGGGQQHDDGDDDHGGDGAQRRSRSAPRRPSSDVRDPIATCMLRPPRARRVRPCAVRAVGRSPARARARARRFAAAPAGSRRDARPQTPRRRRAVPAGDRVASRLDRRRRRIRVGLGGRRRRGWAGVRRLRARRARARITSVSSGVEVPGLALHVDLSLLSLISEPTAGRSSESMDGSKSSSWAAQSVSSSRQVGGQRGLAPPRCPGRARRAPGRSAPRSSAACRDAPRRPGR